MELELKIIDGNSLVTFVDNRHLYDSRVLIIHPDFGLPPQDHELVEFGVTFLEESWRSIDPSHNGHLYDYRVLIIHPDFGLPPQNHGFNLRVGRVWSHILGGELEEFMEGVSRRLDQIESSRQDHHPVGISTDETVPHASQTSQVLPLGTLHGVPFHLSDHCETAPPSTATVSSPIDGSLTWGDRDGVPVASLPIKFRMPDIECYSGIGCPKIRLRLYNTVMRAHGIDDAQLVALFPMSLSGAAQRWFASVKPLRLRTWEDRGS
ncbi:hypothetical protein CK203_091928 [Vitis vinifera]|uniref:Retrotransposon gag domain-containing protein n=1 Tax=Vitis vinifera TaxID=29760 RepID=A0A438BRI9_VITVI|nr:hypothetical protein CK203_091928 [Vitis vinifera]